MSDKVKSAVELFNEGFSCSQAILATFCEDFGLDKEMALRVAGGFGGGMARLGETCGAVTGAFMIIGLKHGKTHFADEDAKAKTYGLIKEFIKKFESRNGCIKCNDLLGVDISTDEGLKHSKEQGLSEIICAKLVQDSAEIIEELIR